MNKSFNKLIKSNVLLAVFSLFAVVLLVSSTTYSLFVKEDKNTTNQAITIGALSAEATSATFTLNGMYPETESSALAKNDNVYAFTVSNDGDYFVNYKVYFTIQSGTIAVEDYRYICFKLDNGGTLTLADIYNSSNRRFYLIENAVLETDVDKEHLVRFWLSEHAKNTMIDKNIVLNLVFESTAGKKSSLITFNALDGVASATKERKFITEPYGKLPTAYKKGYTFEGWYTDTSYETKVTESNIDNEVNDRTLYAKYTSLNGEADNLATKLVLDVYGVDSDLYNHSTDAYGNNEQAIANFNSLNVDDGSYRYSGANPNNYICFGTNDKSTCLNDISNNGNSKYLYRIIGIFNDNVKIIMANPLYNTKTNTDKFRWDYNGSNLSNDWENASLKQWLNGETLKNGAEAYYPDYTFMSLYDSAGSTTWSDKIATYDWLRMGYSSSSRKSIYDYEESKKCYNFTLKLYDADICEPVTAKIGLMRASDYAYSSITSDWDKQFGSSTYENISWLNLTAGQYTIGGYYGSSPTLASSISRSTSNGNYYYYIGATSVSVEQFIRPAMYLNSNAHLVSGTGEANNPYIIE